jgi:hypothetical protein
LEKKIKVRDHSEDLGVDREITLEWIREIGLEGMDWIHLVQDRD